MESMSLSWPGVNRHFIRKVLLFALLYFAVLVSVNAMIFLLSHIPPTAMNIDRLLLGLGSVERFLVWPRLALRKLWPSESTPVIFNYLLPVLNCLIWGLLLATINIFWKHVRK